MKRYKLIPFLIALIILISYLNYNKQQVILSVSSVISKYIISTPDVQPEQKHIIEFLKYCSSNKTIELNGKYKYTYYTKNTVDQWQFRMVKAYINKCLVNMNQLSQKYFSNTDIIPYVFEYVDMTECAMYSDTFGNERWIIDVYVQENVSQFNQRFILDLTVLFKQPPGKPQTNSDLIAGPMDVINTGSPLFIIQDIPDELDNISVINLNCISLFNSNLILGAKQMCAYGKKLDGPENTSLESSVYPTDKPMEPTLSESIKLNIDKNININNYALTPPKYNRKKLTDKYHYETAINYEPKYSLKNVNKWDKLWDSPIDVPENNRNPHNFKWNELGIYEKNIEWPTSIENKPPLYWPTITGQPINGGANYWLFDNLAGFPQNTHN